MPAANRLTITFDGPEIRDHGVPADCVADTLAGIQEALARLTAHLARAESPEKAASQPDGLVRDQSVLKLKAIRPGSLVLEMERAPTGAYFHDFGSEALRQLLHSDGTENSGLPPAVTDSLFKVRKGLPERVRVFLGDDDGNRRLELLRATSAPKPKSEPEPVFLRGWLKEVNWKERTAQLHGSSGPHVLLKFEPGMDELMRQLATLHVEVEGSGRFGKADHWSRVTVSEIRATRPAEPFDLDKFLAKPNLRPIEPDDLVTMDLTDEEWTAFRRAIREGKDT